MVMFYATAEGVVFEDLVDPLLAEEANSNNCDHNSSSARTALAKKLKSRNGGGEQSQQQQQQQQNNEEHDDNYDHDHDYDHDDERYHHIGGDNNIDHHPDDEDSKTALIAVQDMENRLRDTKLRMEDIEREKSHNRFLADAARRDSRGSHNRGESSKAIPSTYAPKQQVADNAAKRAIVHHTGSHYHMAGSKQFQRGVRVKGVISRHSKQGAKMQAARVSGKNMFAAREDAKGQRTAGGGQQQSKGKSSKKKKKGQKGGGAGEQ